MPRRARSYYPNQYYHIFNIGFDSKKIFKHKQDYIRFLIKLEESNNKFDWIIYSYCLMPNHYHIHVQIRSDPLSKIIHSLQTSHSVYFNKRYKHFSPVFTGRFKSILIQKEQYHVNLSKYIHVNPVKEGLARKPQEYPYSSYPEIINQPKHEFKIIDKRAIKSITGSLSKNAINMYRKFIEETDEVDYSPKNQVRGIIGSARFRSQFE